MKKIAYSTEKSRSAQAGRPGGAFGFDLEYSASYGGRSGGAASVAAGRGGTVDSRQGTSMMEIDVARCWRVNLDVIRRNGAKGDERG